MPSQTSGKNLPYPLGTDRLMDGDDAIRKLAQSVDNMVQAATVTVPVTAANTPASVTWTFPVAYSAPPVVLACPAGGTAIVGRGTVVAPAQAITNTSVAITAQTSTGTGAVPVWVIAVGPVSAVT